MGTALVELAHMARGRHPKMTDRAYIVLLSMAHNARDPGRSDAPCVYFRGLPYLRHALVPTAPESAGADRAAYRAIRELIGYGLVTREASGAPGRNAVYMIHLDPW